MRIPYINLKVTYYCDELCSLQEVEITREDMWTFEAEHMYLSTTVIADIKCKCGKVHEIILI